MAGHSKWANIRFKKGAKDAKRGKLFTKLIREVMIASKISGADPASNPRLRTAIDKALGANMTRDAVDRAIKRGAGAADEDNLMEISYEGYGVGGVAVLVECMTDNKNRSVSEVRHCFSKYGGNMGTDGSVSFLFTKLGQFFIEAKDEDVLDAALEAEADDVLPDGPNACEVRCAPERYHEVKQAMAAAGFKVTDSDITWLPTTLVSLDAEQAQSFLIMLDKMEDLDDVQNVYSNADISEDILNNL